MAHGRASSTVAVECDQDHVCGETSPLSDHSGVVRGNGAWRSGDAILMQGIWNGHLISARPATVVGDQDDLLVLYFAHGAAWRRGGLTKSERDELSREALVEWNMDPEPRALSDATIEGHILMFLPTHTWYSLLLLFAPDWTVRFWYVNFQMPVRRSTRGIIIRDLVLDIVVHENGAWVLKDEDEFRNLLDRGYFPPPYLAGVERAKSEAIGRIKGWRSPFCDGWEGWRPEPSWTGAALPADWRTLDNHEGIW